MFAFSLSSCLGLLLLIAAGCSATPSAAKPEKDDANPPVATSASEEPAASPSPKAPPTAPAKKASSELIAAPAELAKSVTLERIHRGLSKPLGLEFFPGDEQRRLFVVEQTGTIRAIASGVVSRNPLLDIRSKISTSHSEQGLLGLAFHPKFKDNLRFYVNYTDREGATRVIEYKANKEATRADPASAVELLKIGQPWRNHNGGGIEFGPDGMLYVGMGDGGAAGDPKRAGQDPENRLGKMLRIDVDTRKVETIQSGLRNPWRFAFDSKTGDLYIGDVGQDKWEEIDVVAAKDIEGANFGWSMWEGNHCFRRRGCDETGMIMPAVEFNHRTGCSVTGGVVYRGKALPELDGAYFYSDFCTAILRSFRWKDGVVSDHWDWKSTLDKGFRLAEVSSFAEDEEGEIYLLSSSGGIYKLSRAP
jgi:glucose/arabinose dehydrogenase